MQKQQLATTAADMAAVGVYRIALGVEYKGSAYHGFQRQTDDVPSIQGHLEQALSQVAGGEAVSLTCAGRTDAMVHACAQVVHFDTQVVRSETAWVMGANRYLPADISVIWAKPMPLEFNARFSAYARRYRYVIYQNQVRPAHLGQEVTWCSKPLNLTKMQQAADQLLGTHDFSAFRAQQCQAKSPIKTIYHLQVIPFGKLIVIDVRADAFLHHMVRNIAGVLMAVGTGSKPVEWVTQVLASKDRTKGGVTAPPYGLYMVKADYPEQFAVPERFLGPLFLTALPDIAQSENQPNAG